MTCTVLALRTSALYLAACCSGALVVHAAGYPQADPQSLEQFRREAAEGVQSGGASQLKLDPIHGVDSTPTGCPSPRALDFFKHQIAYERTEDSNPFKGSQELHADVWQRGPLTAFYVREKLNDFAPGIRMTYLFGEGGLQGGGTCPVEKSWRECVEGFAHNEYIMDIVGICATTLETGMIPAWKPSPNDQTKRRVADELRKEIEVRRPGVQEIVLRDFNLEDNQIMMYLKMPDGEYYEGCGFHAMSAPHCEKWHLFGMSPTSSIRKRIFELPYRLK